MKDGAIDYSGYGTCELHEALARIRNDLYPKNHENLLAALTQEQAGAVPSANTR